MIKMKKIRLIPRFIWVVLLIAFLLGGVAGFTVVMKVKEKDKWPHKPDLEHFEEAVYTLQFPKQDGMANYMPGSLFSKILKFSPNLDEVHVSVVYAAPFRELANSNFPIVRQNYRRIIVRPLAKYYNMYLGSSIKRPFPVTFYFYVTYEGEASEYVKKGLLERELLSFDRVWLLRFPSSYEDAMRDDTVE